jgi:hypothetical protein
MIGPRNSVVRALMGEMVPVDEILCDMSSFVNSAWLTFQDLPELWVDKLYEGHYPELED